jgi:hypothetical protein
MANCRPVQFKNSYLLAATSASLPSVSSAQFDVHEARLPRSFKRTRPQYQYLELNADAGYNGSVQIIAPLAGDK